MGPYFKFNNALRAGKQTTIAANAGNVIKILIATEAGHYGIGRLFDGWASARIRLHIYGPND
jgi:hypothetical protein